MEIVYLLYALVTVILFFIGASVFSFLGVVIYRLPRGLRFTTGRSFCPGCGHELGPLELVPVFSYLFLRGRCRWCKAKIPARELLREMFGGSLLPLCCLYCGFYDLSRFGGIVMAGGLVLFAFLAVLYLVAALDAQTQDIPDGCPAAIMLLAVPHFFLTEPQIRLSAAIPYVIGVFAASGILFAIALIIPGAFGGGDVKLMAAAGLFLGWKLVLFALFAAIVTGGAYAIVLLARRLTGPRSHIAFGPFLAAGCALAVFAGTPVLNWYLSLIIW